MHKNHMMEGRIMESEIGAEPYNSDLDKEEWREVCKHVRPDISDAEFDKQWADYLENRRKARMH